MVQKIGSFASFVDALHKTGFSIGGSNDEGIFSLSNYFDNNIRFHTGDPETDPWEWRIRSLIDCSDLAYGKFFFNKGGWITREWFPYFMSVRRKHKTFEQIYQDGCISNFAKKIYELIRDNPDIALHEIKVMTGNDKKLSSKIESALTFLQMNLFITISGEKRKVSYEGNEYGWPGNTYCTVENFFGREIFELSRKIDTDEAIDKITDRILELNPAAEQRAIDKFLG